MAKSKTKLGYSKEIMKHFTNPKNVGEFENPDIIGTSKNDVCGDLIKVYIKLKDNKIKDIKFQTLGCPAAIATSDVLCEIVKGKTIEQVKKIKKKDILKKLGDLPPIKEHCSILGLSALKDALKKYES